MSEKVLQQQPEFMIQEEQNRSDENEDNAQIEMPPEVENAVNEMGLNEMQKGKLMQALSISEQYSGPIPHPRIIEGYEKIIPGAADRILTMAEKEAEHRHEMDGKFYKTDSRDSLLGILSAFILTGILAIGGIVIILKVPETWGTVTGCIMAGGSVGTILTTFIKGTKATWKINNNKE